MFQTAIEAGSPVAEAAPPILEIRGVSKAFGAHQAVHPLDLDIRSGEFVTLLGPSGCGKTTLLRMIAGLEVPTTGRLTSRGEDVTRLRPERRRFNMVFQSYALFPHLDVYENVAYGLRAKGMAEAEIAQRVEAALAMVGLAGHRSHAVEALSGGMSQRVALVRAIVNEPHILLLDEPLAALDLQLRKRMQLELRAIQQRLGTTFVLVTHDQEEALVMSDRIVVMNAGRVEQVGTPRDIYRRPGSRFVAEFIGETSLVSCRIERTGAKGVEVSLANGARGEFECFCGDGLAPGDGGAVSLRPEDASLVAPGEGLFRGRVTNVVFTGAATRLTIAVDPGFELRVSAGPDCTLTPGEEVGVALAPGAGVFVPDAG